MKQVADTAYPGQGNGRPPRSGARRWVIGIGATAAIVVGVVAIWDWDWFIPMTESRASSAIGRKVTIAHLHVRLGRRTVITAAGIRVAEPDGFPSDKPFAQAARLGVTVDIVDYLLHRTIDIPLIELDQPQVEAIALSSGQTNYDLHLASGGGSGPAPTIGQLAIKDGTVHVAIARLQADFQLAVQTRPAAGVVAQHGQSEEIAVDAHGTYAAQPITGTLQAGGLLSLRDTQQPYPIDLHLANGSTHVSLVGTLKDVLSFAGADLRLDLAGQSMSNLYALTAIPIPDTPPYDIAGHLTYSDGKIRFEDIQGRVGHSDLEGSVAEAPGKDRPDVTLDLVSRQVDMADLGGFIGAAPDSDARHPPSHPPGRVLPTTPVDIPKLQSTDVHLTYQAHHIEGRSIPFDAMTVKMDVIDGAITLHPITLTVGTGDISGQIAITPLSDRRTHLKGEVDFNRVDLARLMAATHFVHGAGAIGGKAQFDSDGNSIASWAANGNGGLSLFMTGGDLSAVLVSLSGLEFGNALVSMMGLPSQTQVRCFVGDWALQHGIVRTRTLMLDTGLAIVRGTGSLDLRDERIDYRIDAEPKHLTIGSLPTPIEITGTLADPGLSLAIVPLVERGALAAALGFVAPPLALLATLQLGVGDPHECGDLVAEAKREARTGTEGAVQVPPDAATPAADSADPASGFHVTGKGDAAVRQLNQEELDRISRQNR